MSRRISISSMVFTCVGITLTIPFAPLETVACQGTDAKEIIHIACVGDSITYGARLDNREQHSYPAQLQKLLGSHFKVFNFGVGSCTLIRKGRPTVWKQLDRIKQAEPDVVIVSLGTNDTCGGRRRCWDHHDEFPADCRDLVDALRDFPSEPTVWLRAPTPMVLKTPGLRAKRRANLKIRKPRLQQLITVIKKVAAEKKTGLIDLNTPLAQRPDLFTRTDGVHPNQAGYRAAAELVAEGLANEHCRIGSTRKKVDNSKN